MSDTEIKYCKRGHPRTPENTNKLGYCKICIREGKRKWRIADIEHQKMKEREYRSRRDANNLREYGKTYRAKNKDKLLEYYHQYYQLNRWRWLDYLRASRKNLSDSYVRDVMGLKANEATEELIEIKRLTIKLHRSLKNGNQVRL